MKKVIKPFVLLLIISVTFNTISQNIAYNSVSNMTKKLQKNNIVINKVLDDGKYHYAKSKEKVLIEINGDKYIEHHPNNEFIKAKIIWSSNNNYKLVITEINKPNLPFIKGTELKTEIVKKKGKKFYYKSELANRNWAGKLVKFSN